MRAELSGATMTGPMHATLGTPEVLMLVVSSFVTLALVLALEKLPVEPMVVGGSDSGIEADGSPATDPTAEPLAPPGWDALPPDVQQAISAMDEASVQTLLRKAEAGDSLTADEQSIVQGFVELARAEMDSQLAYRTGDILLADGLATIHIGADFRYLDPEHTEKVIVDVWGNPPGQKSLGMIVPKDVSPLDPVRGWGVIVSYVEEGHVDDEDAEDIDFDALLTEMKEATEADNESRAQQGYPPLHLVGWAEPPHYDQDRHSLYWAKELSSDDGVERSLNYAIRVLGRKGVLELNAVAGMSQLGVIKPEMEKVFRLVEFQTGNRYVDFDPDIDEVAAYGIGGLIAGKLAMKAGLFAGLVKLLVAGKKFLVVGVFALLAGIKAFFARKKSRDTTPRHDG